MILIAFSFNDSRRNIVLRGFTLDDYNRASQNASDSCADGLALRGGSP